MNRFEFRTRDRSARRGFTLLELIISVALVLVLMLAVTKIFSIAGDTVGATQGIAAAVRDGRAAQAVMARDFSSLASDSPFIWIRYEAPTPAFRNAADAASDRDYQAGVLTANGESNDAQKNAKLTIDLDQNGVEGETAINGELIGKLGPPTPITSLTVDERSHRLDRISFFARDQFRRQTGNTAATMNLPGSTDVRDEVVAAMTSSEAWITYGHLTLPRTDGKYVLANNSGTDTTTPTSPGAGSEQNNPLNFYASQWVLGRVAMTMVLPTNGGGANPATEFIVNGVPQQFYRRTVDWTDINNLSPFTSDTRTNQTTPAKLDKPLRTARYDLIGSDLATTTTLFAARQAEEASTPGSIRPWYAQILNDRFQVNPFVVKPIDAYSASQQVPAFLPACSQFIVEYAGDFVSQNADGSLNTSATMGGLTPDGVVDFVCDLDTTGNVLSRQTQWFGYPRSITGANTVEAGKGDTVLLGDFVNYISFEGFYPKPGTAPYQTYGAILAKNPKFGAFEKFIRPTATPNVDVVESDKNAVPASYIRTQPPLDPSSNLPWTIYAAWGPDSVNDPEIPRPKMYRITVSIDRPEMAGKAAGGQTFEYVFNVR